MGENVIEVKDLVKIYGELRAVDGITFEVERGEVFAFLGPNGAGKTTTVEMIETLRTPTSGSINILGLDVRKDRREILKRIGVLPQEFNSYDRLTVGETVKYYAALFCSDCDVEKLIKLVNLDSQRDQLYMNLSGGLKQRVGIAVSLVNDPEIVFLDEPTTGLDPKARRDVWEVIRGLKEENKTIFLTTHYMEEAEVLADYVGIIAKGKIIAYGTTNELIDNHFKNFHVVIKGGGDGVKGVASEMGFSFSELNGGDLKIDADSNDHIVDFLNKLRERGVKYQAMDIRKPNLEELFLDLTGESLTEQPGGGGGE